MIDALTARPTPERPAVRRCPAADCRHRLLPVQDHCPACGRAWRPTEGPTIPPPRPESPWEAPAFLASMTVITAVTVLPVAIMVLILIAGLARALTAAI